MSRSSHTSRSRIRRIATTGALTALMTVGLAGGAVAADPDGPGGAPPSKRVSKAELERLESIPMKKIIRQAEPLPMPKAQGPVEPEPQAPDGRQITVEGARAKLSAGSPKRNTSVPAPAVAAAQNGLWTGAFNANPNRQVGKLWFDTIRGPGVNWSHCSATAVNSENKSVVVTAGHCVYNTDPDRNGDGYGDGYIDGDGYWYENIQFCPGYEYSCKLGVWKARQMFTTNSWFYGTGGRYDWSDDMAVVVVHPNTQGRLVNVVGGHGIAFNQYTGLNRHAFGYPAQDRRFPAYSYNGEDLAYCPGRDGYDNAGHIVIYCTMTGGASGGGWLNNVNSAWMGTLNGVNSHKPLATTMGSPYFGSAEAGIFQRARAF
jgi:hypothetical protein